MSMKKEDRYAQYQKKLIHSQAFQNLSTPGHKILAYVKMQLLIKNIGTKKKPNFVCINPKEVQILYGSLNKSPWFMSNSAITRGIDQLLHKGLIKVVEQGGRAKGHASIFSTSDDYLKWKKGDPPVSVRRPYSKRGFCLQTPTKK